MGAISAHKPVVGRALWVPSETLASTHPAGPHGLLRRRDPADSEDLEQGRDRLPAYALPDPLSWQMALHPGITPMVGGQPSPQTPPAALPLREDLQHLINGLARRVAWGGDRRKGSARIELSEGPLAGATLLVHTEQRAVNVELELPAGGSLAGDWQQRIVDRLEERGFSAQVRVG